MIKLTVQQPESVRLTVEDLPGLNLSPEEMRIIEAVSPVVSLARTAEGTLLIIKDIKGRHESLIYDGANAAGSRVEALAGAELFNDRTVEAIGIPEYLEDITPFAAYGITEPGWYIFARIHAKYGVTVTEETAVIGAAGWIAETGNDYLDIAIRFEVASMAQKVTVSWGDYAEDFIFRDTDLAVRNLDYMATFYVYDLERYATWTYAMTTDTAFVAGKTYYTLENGEYILADVTAGASIPENTYYNHTKLRLEGMIRNVTYKLNELVTYPIEIVLPEVEDDGHGCWFEMQLRHGSATSITMLPAAEGVKVNTAGASAAISAGINVVDLHYTNIDGIKMWTLANVHTNIPT